MIEIPTKDDLKNADKMGAGPEIDFFTQKMVDAMKAGHDGVTVPDRRMTPACEKRLRTNFNMKGWSISVENKPKECRITWACY